MEGEEFIELELNIDELVDVALVNIDLHSVDVNDIAPPTIKISDAKRHASLWSNFVLENSLYFGVHKIVTFLNLVGNLDKVTIASLGRQHQKYLNSYFKSS